MTGRFDNFNTNVKYVNKLPDLPLDGLVIYDAKLLRHSDFQKWILKYKHSYKVTAGEKLKDLKNFHEHVQKIYNLTSSQITKNTTIVGVGGGSVGDFTGFLASVLKRGTKLIHIPSTWLAAIDSAHGGKTALNLNEIKNQIGTFYPADHIYIVKDLLFSQPQDQCASALGELLKAALISGGIFWKKLSQEKTLSHQLIWKYLPQAIALKYKIVKRDPFENKGIRYLLNLGHTLGHIIESKHQVAHGIAVGYGIQLSAQISVLEGFMQKKDYQKLISQPAFQLLVPLNSKIKLTEKEILQGLAQDKKSEKKNFVNYVFIQKPGQVFAKSIAINEIQKQYRVVYNGQV